MSLPTKRTRESRIAKLAREKPTKLADDEHDLHVAEQVKLLVEVADERAKAKPKKSRAKK